MERIEGLDDCRNRKDYRKAELITACLMMFLLKEGSRNAMNNERKEAQFQKNYFRLFKMRLPHMDTVEDFLRLLGEQELEGLKAGLLSVLIEKKVFHKFRLLGKRFVVAIDGTGVASYGQDYSGECLSKTSKNGQTTWFHHVLEAKLVTSNGIVVSLATEWIANDKDRDFDKQDCEQKAFKRLAVKLKQYFPRLPVCIVADGLYPNQHFFRICQENGWGFIVVLQDGNLRSLQEEVELLPSTARSSTEWYMVKGQQHITCTYQWINGLDYKGHSLNWIECREEIINRQSGKKIQRRFVHITNLPLTGKTARQISTAGRLRWKIENEGFNTQKNQGYELGHKYSRTSFLALKNYYQCMQIAHMINQLVTLSAEMTQLLLNDTKLTIKHLWKGLIGFLKYGQVCQKQLDHIREKRWQVRLAA